MDSFEKRKDGSEMIHQMIAQWLSKSVVFPKDQNSVPSAHVRQLAKISETPAPGAPKPSSGS